MNIDKRELPSLLGTEVAIRIQVNPHSFDGMSIFIYGTLKKFNNGMYMVSHCTDDKHGSSDILFTVRDIKLITGDEGDVHVLWFKKLERSESI